MSKADKPVSTIPLVAPDKPAVRKEPEPSPVLLEGELAAKPQDAQAVLDDPDPKVMAEDNHPFPQPEPAPPVNPDLEFADNGDLVLGGSRVGRIFHKGAVTGAMVPYGTPAWTLEIMDTDEFDAVHENHGSQQAARLRAQELLEGKESLKAKPGRRRR